MSNLILCGFKASGKTYFGKSLSLEMGRPFIETDTLIEAHHGEGLSCREIHKKIGEKGFRDLEYEAVSSLKEKRNCVISLGGGTLFQNRNLMTLKNIGILIYLEISKETLKKRIFSGGLPAYFDKEDPGASFEHLYQKGLPIFEKLPNKICLEGKEDSLILQELKSYGI